MAQESLPAHDFRTLTCAHCGHQIRVSIDCKFRFCEICAPRRAARIRRRLAWLIDKTQKIDNHRFKLITLSMANCSDVASGIKQLVSSFRRLRQRSLWKNHVAAGAFVIEITGRPGSWHPHIHAIVYSTYIPWRRLHQAWKRVSTGNAVYISAVDSAKACAYITKYISKSSVPEFAQPALSDDLRQFRLFQRFGLWHSLKVPRRLYDYPCEKCSQSDWLNDWALHHGHYREVASLADV